MRPRGVSSCHRGAITPLPARGVAIPLVPPTPAEVLRIQGSAFDAELARIGDVVGPPTVLVPGLAASPIPFVLHERRSLAQTLTVSGRTPWLVDFRVHWRAKGQDASALFRVLDRVLARLADHTGVPPAQTDAIGHSLGGILLLALASQGRPLHRLVALASALDYRLGRAPLPRALSLAPKGLRPIRLRFRHGGIPVRGLAELAGPIFGRGINLPLQRDQFHPGSTPGTVIRAMMKSGVRDMPLALLLELADLFTDTGLFLGHHDRPVKDLVEDAQLPVLFVAARQDTQCPLGAVQDVARRMPNARLIEVGGSGAPGEGYGHVDLMTASRAPEEVFDPIVAFLDEDRSAQEEPA